MDCRHATMTVQEFNKKIMGFKSTYELTYFLIYFLFEVKFQSWSYCFCDDNDHGQCEICIIEQTFSVCAEIIREKNSQLKLFVWLWLKINPAPSTFIPYKKTAICCFLGTE